ncbi:MAG: ABC transporter ATP-binding protein [Chloroflexi bacterium]|nr:ABC transporter ATP-binding protein [Chloroflexota bacterium]MCC6891726.1 ABC transporter ATP-binding protein [Anaerolineae bacterium]
MQLTAQPRNDARADVVQKANDIVQVKQVTRELPLGNEQISILRGISFAIPRYSWIAIMGSSGSGKSTLLGLLAGLDTPSSGEIHVDGVDITHMDEGKLARFRNEKIGMVFQSFNLIPTLTALENVEVPLFASRSSERSSARAKRMLELVRLGDRLHHRPNQLSGGQQQRVAIARALVNEPNLLVADEPTGNLDSVTGEAILDLFDNLRKELGLTIVIATHDRAVAARVDGILHLADGLLVEDGR